MNIKQLCAALVTGSIVTSAVGQVAATNPLHRAWLLLPIWFVIGLAVMIVVIKHMTHKPYKDIIVQATVIFAFSFGITYFISSFFWFAFFKKILIGIQSQSFDEITVKLIQLIVSTAITFIVPFLASILVQTIIARLFFSDRVMTHIFAWLLLGNLIILASWILIASTYFYIVGVPLRHLVGY